MNASNATITVRWSEVGFHRWPDAPGRRAYLRDMHRHLFKFEAWLEVDHDDRDVEYHDMLDACRSFSAWGDVAGGAASPDASLNKYSDWSCERHARHIAAAMQAKWPGRRGGVRCSEDGEFDACVSF